MSNPLMLHQEVVLLALRDDKGTFASGMYLYSVAGSMLSELLLQQRIITNDDKQETVAVIDDSKTGCDILDELLAEIGQSKKHKGLQDWVYHAAQIKELNHRIAESLCDKGILKKEVGKVFFVFSRTIYPELEGSYEDAIRRRMADIMFQKDAKADSRTGVLIALALHGSLLTPNFAPDELSQHKDRIKEIAEGQHLAAGATQAAIEAVQAAMNAALIASTVATTVATTAAINN